MLRFPPPHTSLQLLRLSSVNMGMEGFHAVLDALASHATLQQIDLSNNFIGGFEPSRFEAFQVKSLPSWCSFAPSLPSRSQLQYLLLPQDERASCQQYMPAAVRATC